jgi:hypothetical protein
MEIDISRPAEAFIRKKGGDLYVWFGTLGGDSLFEHVATKRPASREFALHEAPGGIRLWLEVHPAPDPDEIRVRRRPWPMGPVEVTWVGGPGRELDPANITAGTSGF